MYSKFWLKLLNIKIFADILLLIFFWVNVPRYSFNFSLMFSHIYPNFN
jgi:hypothetical protein